MLNHGNALKMFYYQNKTRLDNSLENDRKIYCFCQKPNFGNMFACDNANLSGFIIPVLTLLG